jgi:hypothetical protein
VYGIVLFPPPACTLTDEDGDDTVALPLPLLLCAKATFDMTQVIAIAVHVNNIIMVLACCLLFIDNFVLYPIDYILFKKKQRLQKRIDIILVDLMHLATTQQFSNFKIKSIS